MNKALFLLFWQELKTDPLVQLVFATLLIMSLLSWMIFFYKVVVLWQVKRKEKNIYTLIEAGVNLKSIKQKAQKITNSPFALLLDIASNAPVNRAAIESVELISRRFLSRGLTSLATIGNVAPFVGLFGTVWGIIKAFHMIGLKGSANLAVVAPGISEALINTALGLFVAIPAVIFYNYLLSKMENIIDEFKAYALMFIEQYQKGVEDEEEATF